MWQISFDYLLSYLKVPPVSQCDLCDEIFNWIWRKAFSKSQKHIIPWNFGHFQNLKIDGLRSRTLLGRLNEWVERVRIGNLFMVFISRENDSFPRYPVRKLADPKVEMNRNLVFEGFNWTLDRNTVLCFFDQAICRRHRCWWWCWNIMMNITKNVSNITILPPTF